jgi:hypothetical protein
MQVPSSALGGRQRVAGGARRAGTVHCLARVAEPDEGIGVTVPVAARGGEVETRSKLLNARRCQPTRWRPPARDQGLPVFAQLGVGEPDRVEGVGFADDAAGLPEYRAMPRRCERPLTCKVVWAAAGPAAPDSDCRIGGQAMTAADAGARSVMVKGRSR